jgi:hypothetical protein
VRRQHGVRRIEDRRAHRRLLLVDVERGPGQAALVERLGHGRLVDHAAAGDVEEERARPHPGERIAPDQATGGAGDRDMDRDHVGALQQRAQLGQLDAVERRLLGGDIRIHAEDRHLEAASAVGDGLPDLAETHDPQGLAAQLRAGELAALPLAAPDGRVRGGDPAGEAEEERQRVLGRRDRVPRRRVDHGDPGPGRGFEIHVVDADAGATDHHEPVSGGDQLGVDLDLAADDQRLIVADRGAQLVA